MLGAGRSLGDSRDVLTDVNGQIIDMVGVVRIIVDHGSTLEAAGSSLERASLDAIRARGAYNVAHTGARGHSFGRHASHVDASAT